MTDQSTPPVSPTLLHAINESRRATSDPSVMRGVEEQRAAADAAIAASARAETVILERDALTRELGNDGLRLQNEAARLANDERKAALAAAEARRVREIDDAALRVVVERKEAEAWELRRRVLHRGVTVAGATALGTVLLGIWLSSRRDEP